MPDEPTPTTQNQDQNVEPKPNKVEARINQLYGEKREAEELVTALQEENGVLRSQIDELSNSVESLKATAPKLETGTPEGETSAGLTPEDKIMVAVQKAVGMVFQQREDANRRAADLKQKHKQSFATAMKQFPDLQNQESELYKTANSLWSRDAELRNSPSGPLKAVIMARGCLDAPVSPSPAGVAGVGGNVGSATSTNVSGDLAKVEAQIEEVKTKLNAGSYTASAWVQYQNLKEKRAALLKQKG
jgi:chromosome segregation ATPase